MSGACTGLILRFCAPTIASLIRAMGGNDVVQNGGHRGVRDGDQ
jgi:hypothetical protein